MVGISKVELDGANFTREEIIMMALESESESESFTPALIGSFSVVVWVKLEMIESIISEIQVGLELAMPSTKLLKVSKKTLSRILQSSLRKCGRMLGFSL